MNYSRKLIWTLSSFLLVGFFLLAGTNFLLAQVTASVTGVIPNLAPGMLTYANLWWPVANGPNLGGGAAEAFYNPLQSTREDLGFRLFPIDSVSRIFAVQQRLLNMNSFESMDRRRVIS